jgi:hypothetical protein
LVAGGDCDIVADMWAALLAIALLAVGGCAARTPPEAVRIHGIAASDAPAIDDCWRKVLASPPHQALRAKLGDHADSPTPEMKANTQRATSEEAALLRSLQQDWLAPCRRMALASAAKVHPTIVAVLTDSYTRADANTQRLVGREITWGEYVSENQAIVTHRRAELLAAGESMQRQQVPAAR